MSENLNDRSYKFLKKWLDENKIPNIRKGMTEDLEQFIMKELSEFQMKQVAEKMSAQKMVEVMPPTPQAEVADEQDPK